MADVILGNAVVIAWVQPELTPLNEAAEQEIELLEGIGNGSDWRFWSFGRE